MAPVYNTVLKQRGSLDVWIAEDVLATWHDVAGKNAGKPGAPFRYPDVVIELLLQLGTVFHQPLRQTQGLAQSILSFMDIRLTIPDYTTLSRRQGCLPGKLGQFIPKSITDMVVDSTGLKFYGEGEWKVKKHGAGKHRMWRKLNLGLDADGEIRAELLTDNGITDADAVGGLLDQQARLATSGQPTNTTTSIAAFFGDGAHDKRKVYDALSAHGVAKIVIPPQKNAKI